MVDKASLTRRDGADIEQLGDSEIVVWLDGELLARRLDAALTHLDNLVDVLHVLLLLVRPF